MAELTRPPRPLTRLPVDRSADRWIALGAMIGALAFLGAGLLAMLLPPELRRGTWLPLHLALAGGATTAIAGVMPFFVAAFAAAPPAPSSLRATGVLAVAAGAAGLAIGVVGDSRPLSVAGGTAFIVGIVATAAAAIRPTRRALGASRGLVTRAYLVALAIVGAGAVIATLYLSGWQPVVAAWDRVRVAHAWLNLVGFISLTIATTLLHFFPTVVGSRILEHRSAHATILGLGSGPVVVSLGVVAGADPLARLGALATLAGAVALAAYAAAVWRRRAKWTTDAMWHRFAIGGLASSISWFVVGIAIAAGRVLLAGADPSSWSVELVVGPLVAGWIGLAMLASVTHLVPAVGPGDQEAHARQRQLLGAGATLRLGAANLGVAALAVGAPLGQPVAVGAGVLLVGAVVVLTAALVATAALVGRFAPRKDRQRA